MVRYLGLHVTKEWFISYDKNIIIYEGFSFENMTHLLQEFYPLYQYAVNLNGNLSLEEHKDNNGMIIIIFQRERGRD